MRFPVAAVIALTASAVFAQAQDRDWLDSKPAAEFRERVALLALIYGESSGIDLRDFRVDARRLGSEKDGCADTEVVTTQGARIVRRDTVKACHPGPHRPAPE